jgi:hypothetical protein
MTWKWAARAGARRWTGLRNVVGRVESSWRPASAEEGFEIVRRRFSSHCPTRPSSRIGTWWRGPLPSSTAPSRRSFHPSAASPNTSSASRPAYPIHPEIFDRLYTDWSTLVKFQRTRGVLRLMAAVIHSLWEKGDRNPLILPGNVAIDDPRVQSELTRYLSDNWVPVIEKDVDGPNSLAAEAGQRIAQSGQVLGLPAGGARHLHGLGTDHGRRAQGHRGSAREAGLRDARRISRRVRRCLRRMAGRRPICIRTGRTTGIRPSRR